MNFNTILNLILQISFIRFFIDYLNRFWGNNFKHIDNGKASLNDFHINSYHYSKETELDMVGWTPIIKEDSFYKYILGLPSKVEKGNEITIINGDSRKTFTHEDSYIDWQGFLDHFVGLEFCDDLD